jgi:predicted small secreted protein
MKRRIHILNMIILIAMLLGACNLPRGESSEDASNTAAAATVQAFLTTTARPITPTPTLTRIPIGPTTLTTVPATFQPAASATSICDAMQFVADVTIPDGTVMTPNQTFTKTWRVKNVGTCAWTPSYSIVFSNGNSMNGPTTQALTGNVGPGQTLDITLNLAAPATPDSYRGFWKLRNAAGVLFGQFYADIKVQATPTITNTVKAPVTITLPYMPAESGLVTSGGSINAATVAAGDSATNQGVEAFLSFNISSIPAGSTIQSASIKLKGGGQVRGDPFGGLGCLRAYAQNFGSVDPTDYVPGGALGAIARWCNATEIEVNYSDAGFVSGVQASVGNSRFQIRLQFNETVTDNDNTIDDVLILDPVTVTVTYLTP